MTASCYISNAVKNEARSRRKPGHPAKQASWYARGASGYLHFLTDIASISLPALQILQQHGQYYRELGRFRRAVNLIACPAHQARDNGASHDALIAVVTQDIGNGPFHIVASDLPPLLQAPAQARWKGDVLRIGPWHLAIGPETRIWNPAPDWREIAVCNVQLLALNRWVDNESSRTLATSAAGAAASDTLAEGFSALIQGLRAADAAAVANAAGRIAGLGTGLTPAGDDVLAGVMVALYATHFPHTAELAASLYCAAAPQTTTLSRAYLAAASRGQTTAAWHRLLAALTDPGSHDLEAAADHVRAFGATSGIRMLQGFTRTCTALTNARHAA